ncbi:MAG TPA: mechanosensitive ion channel domain-containing protein [Stellaceae bacterium]|nr:mechanosensitive ion channel domain-containing protein [Stellaceae bacterium]
MIDRRRLRAVVPALILAAGLLSAPAAAQTKPPAQATSPAAASPTTLTAAQARQALEVLQDAKKRDELIAVLRAIAATAPIVAPAPPSAPAAEPAPASAPAAAPGSAVTLRPDSLGAQLLVALSGWSSRVARDAGATAQAMTNVPGLWQWLVELATDPSAASSFLVALAWLVLVVGCALGFEFVSGLALRRPRDALAHHLPGSNGESTRLLRLLPFALVRFFLDLVPVAVFAVTGNLLIAVIPEMTLQTRLVVTAIVNAYAICRAVMCVGRLLVSPSERRLRLWRLDADGAHFIILWLRRIVIIAVFGDALIEVALLLGLDQRAHDGLARLNALVLALLLIVVVIRSRREVAAYIRSPRGIADTASRWRVWLAEAWPYLAVITIVSAWVGMATGDRSGLAALYFPGVTLAAVIGARIATIIVLGTLERLLRLDPQTTDKLPGFNQRIAHYRRPLEFVTVTVIAVLSAVVLLQLWGAPAFAWFVTGGIGHRLVSALVTITVAVIAAIVIWEVTQALLERHLGRAGDDGPLRSARLLTLLPMLRTALLTVILTVVGLTALSEIGVNIAPLLAGASIAGIAIGFGAQRLVQDVITGMFVLFENAIQIGDGVTVAGLSGSVEALSVRTIRLRAGDGAVHIIPFSAVTAITNNNRGLGNAAVSVTVAYETDTDRVCEILREIAAELRQDPDFATRIIGDFSLWGVDAVRPWGATILGQIPCIDSGRWPVQREFNRRMKKRFEEEKIVLSGPPGASA